MAICSEFLTAESACLGRAQHGMLHNSNEKQGLGRIVSEKTKILFLCTGNSCRSQMAEGWARSLKFEEIEAFSAGIVAHGLNQVAVQVMAEAGVDIGQHRSKRLNQLGNLTFDYVVTVCADADEKCPVLSGDTKVVHHGFDDPPRLAATVRTDEDATDIYRRVRDEIRDYVETLPEALHEVGS